MVRRTERNRSFLIFIARIIPPLLYSYFYSMWINKPLLVLSPRQADGVLGEQDFILRTSRSSTLRCSPPRGKLRFPRPPFPAHSSPQQAVGEFCTWIKN